MASTNIQTFPGKVGVSNTNPIHTLDIGSNVYIEDTADTKFRVYGNIHASGITVDGSITVIETDNLSVKDPVLLLAAGSTGTSDTGIIMKRSDGDSNVAIFYDEGVGLKLGHTMSSGDDIHLSVDTANALATSVYGPVNVVNSGTQALSVDGGAQVDGNFQVGVVSNLFVDTATSNVGIGTTSPAYKLEVDGKVGIQDELKVAYDADTASYIGRAAVGYMGQSDQASFSHVDKNTSANFALKQAASGATHVNTPTGQHIRFSVNASEVGRFTGGGDFEVGTSASTKKLIVDTSASEVQMYSQATGSTAGPDLVLMRDNPNNGANNEYIGQIRYEGLSDTGTSRLYAKTTGKIKTATNGSEDGVIETMIKTGGSNRISVRHSGAKFLIQKGTDLQVGEVANLYVDTSTSRVGINVASPSYTLDVAGDINLSGDFYQGGSPFVSSLWTENAGKLYYNGGNVGIGTTSPQYKLDVDGGTTEGDGDVMLRMFGGVNKVGKLIFGRTGNSDIRSHAIESITNSGGANNYMKFLVHDGGSSSPYETRTEVMTLLGNGNVGIGTTSPIAALDIDSGASDDTTPALAIRGSRTESDLYVLNTYNVNTGAGYAAKVIGVNIKNKVETDNTIQIRTNTGGLTSAGAIYLGSDDLNQGIFGVLGGTGAVGTTLTELLTVKANGNVGIGTTSPGCKLHVNGAICLEAEDIGQFGVDNISDAGNRTNTYIAFGHGGTVSDWAYLRQIGSSNGNHIALDFHDDGDDAGFSIRDVLSTANPDTVTTRFMVERGGNVGIGTTSPSSSLHVNLGNASGEQHIRATQTSLASSTAGIRFGDSTWDAFIDHSHGAKDLMNFGFYRNPTRQVNMVLTHEGNVGIGTTSPNGNLHIMSDLANASSQINPSAQLVLHSSLAGLDDDGDIGASLVFTQRWLDSSPNSHGTMGSIHGFKDLSAGNYGGGLLFKTQPGSDTAPVERMRIDRDGNVGIGTTSPDYTLDVNGYTRVGNQLRVGKNTNDETEKTIFFGGTYADNDYNHAVIERRIYSSSTEKQELLLFCGNDGMTAAGPDRIRLKGAQILFDVLNNSTDRTSTNTKMLIKSDGKIEVDEYISQSNFPIASLSDDRARNITNVVLNSSNFYNKTWVNNGNHFNSSNGRFTCPIDGIYRIYFRCSADGGTTGNNVRLRKNGGTINEAYHGGQVVRHSVSSEAVVSCNANDYLEIEVSQLYCMGGTQHKQVTFQLVA